MYSVASLHISRWRGAHCRLAICFRTITYCLTIFSFVFYKHTIYIHTCHTYVRVYSTKKHNYAECCVYVMVCVVWNLHVLPILISCPTYKQVKWVNRLFFGHIFVEFTFLLFHLLLLFSYIFL